MRCEINRKRWTAAIGALGLLLAQACTVGPRYHAPAPPSVSGYTPQPQPSQTASSAGAAGAAQRLSANTDVPADWWTLFRSPELDRMVRDALAASPTLEQATARLKQAQEELKARRGATHYPVVSGNASVEEEQLNLAAFGIPFPNPSPFTLLDGSVAVSYALDIFGENRRVIEALRAQRDYQAWQAEGARLMLVGNVASAVIRQAQLREQLDLTRKMLDVEERQLRIVEERYRAGGVAEFAVHSQAALVAQTRANLPALEQQIAVVNDELALLMGKTPAEARVFSVSLERLHLPQELPLSVPSALVRQRPDIRASEALLHQASANVGVATANLYPQIELSGSGGALGTSLISGGGIWNVGGALAQPIFNGGALRAEQRRAQAAYEEAGSVYKQTVLVAFQQVADTLCAIEHDAQALAARTDAANQADASFRIAAERYRDGGISQRALLDAQRQKLQTSLDQTAAAANRYADSAALLQALGGGWWNRQQAVVDAVTP